MKKIVISLTALLAFFSAQSLLAAGFHTPQASASYVGQGQTGITSLENASMVVHNPAAMVFLPQGTQTYGGFVRYDTEYNYDTLEGESNPLLPPTALGSAARLHSAQRRYLGLRYWRHGSL